MQEGQVCSGSRVSGLSYECLSVKGGARPLTLSRLNDLCSFWGSEAKCQCETFMLYIARRMLHFMHAFHITHCQSQCFDEDRGDQA